MRDSALIVSLLPISALLAFNVTAAQAASLDRQVAFSIPSQPLEGALLEFSRQADIQLALDANELDHIQAPELKGTLAASVALRRLLNSSGFRYYTVGNTVTVRRTGSATDESTTSSDSAVRSDSAPVAQHYIATAAPDADQSSGRSKDESRPGPPLTPEVLVTAQKREERLQDVPIPVTAISANTLLEENQVRLQDYYTRIPGLSIAPNAQSAALISIRGITTGLQSNPTVGIVVDDLPFGSSTNTGGGLVIPDIDPGDLSRVEVLRGPQGTLYGASSMGGLLKFVTMDPSTDALTGRAQVGTSEVYHGVKAGYDVRGSANVPLTDTIAIRASGFSRRDPGYIDDPGLHARGVNEQDVYGGHVSALWRASDRFSLKLSALLQEIHGYGSGDVDALPGLTGLQQDHVLGTGQYGRKVETYSATINTNFAGISAVSITGYNRNEFSDALDYTSGYGPLTESIFGTPNTSLPEASKTNKFTEEIRLSASVTDKLDWLLGFFFTHEESPFEQRTLALDPGTGVPIGGLLTTTFPTTYQEYSVFGDLTIRPTDRISIQFGGRESQLRQSYTATSDGQLLDLFGLPNPSVIPKVHSKGNSFTYLVTPQYRISADVMAYIRVASGYRAGGPNTGFNVPRQYEPDRTQNYELGVKGDFLDHRISLDASLYHINWRNIQLLLNDPNSGFNYIGNSGGAKSQGVEFSVQARPLQSLVVTTWVAWSDAKLTKALPPDTGTFGAVDDKLPYSNRFSGSISVQQTFPVTDSAAAFVGGTVSYVGERLGEFADSAADRQVLPAYAKTDFRVGANINSWTLNLFATNAFDRRGLLTGGQGTVLPFSYYYIQPRTIGLEVSKTF